MRAGNFGKRDPFSPGLAIWVHGAPVVVFLIVLRAVAERSAALGQTQESAKSKGGSRMDGSSFSIVTAIAETLWAIGTAAIAGHLG
jgi:hypothetical protein